MASPIRINRRLNVEKRVASIWLTVYPKIPLAQQLLQFLHGPIQMLRRIQHARKQIAPRREPVERVGDVELRRV